MSKTIWGDISQNGATLAVYFVQWTVGAPDHKPNIDLVIGVWGEGTEAGNRFLVSLLYMPGGDGGSFMVIDGEDRLASKRSVCGRALRRAEVVGASLAVEVFALVDALWLTDPRMIEVRALNNEA
jgi:hypothetical protein